MKILAVTGSRAESLVRSEVGNRADVFVVPGLEIAAFLTPKMLSRYPELLRNYDLVLISGLISEDFSKLERDLGVKIRLGPKHASDLDLVLDWADEIEFSHTTPACELISERIRARALDRLSQVEIMANSSSNLAGIKLGSGSRIKLISQIQNADRVKYRELIEEAQRRLEQGADIICLGTSQDPDPEAISNFRKLKSELDCVLGVDSPNDDFLVKLSSSLDLVMSLDASRVKRMGSELRSSQPWVVIADPDLEGLLSGIHQAELMGIENLIADPILMPLFQGFSQSLLRYLEFKRILPEIPTLMGICNLVELMDVDSHGVTGLILGLAAEIGVELVMVTEASPKTRNNTWEASMASKMMSLARAESRPPKDLGMDLLILKQKRRMKSIPHPVSREIRAQPPEKLEPDPRGGFRIWIQQSKIHAMNTKTGECITGTQPEWILNSLIQHGLVSRLEHAGYLGMELAKARIALSLDRDYLQDEPLFRSGYEEI